jgi:hypothetical protein
MRGLGRFQLQGLPELEELFQVEAPGLDSGFPALRSADPV